VRNFGQRSLTASALHTDWGRRAGSSNGDVMKTTAEEANTWLFKVVIIFIVAGFLLSLIPLAKAQGTQKGNEYFLNTFHGGGL
jgi:hypothetical protein